MVDPVKFNNGMQSVPAQNIIDTGRIQVYQDGASGPIAEQTLNVHSNDSLATNIRRVADEAAQAIYDEAQVPGTKMHELFQKKGEWHSGDRTHYERRLAEEVSQRMDNVPGLHEYRVPLSMQAQFQNDGLNYQGDFSNSDHITDINEVSMDIDAYSARAQAEGGTAQMNSEGAVRNGFYKEFNCQEMSAVEVTTMQLAENQLRDKGMFNENDPNTNDFKQHTNYHVVTGGVKFQNHGNPGAHQFIMSEISGNIIESTADPSNANGTYGTDTYIITEGNIHDIANGETLLAMGGNTGTKSVYGGWPDGANSVAYNQEFGSAAYTQVPIKKFEGGFVESQEVAAPVDDGINTQVSDAAVPSNNSGDDGVDVNAMIVEEALIDRAQLDNGSASAFLKNKGDVGGQVQDTTYAPPVNAPEYSVQDLTEVPAIQGRGDQVLDFDPAVLETQTMLTQLGYELKGANNGRDGLEGPSTRENVSKYMAENNLPPETSMADLQDHMVGQIVEQKSALDEVLKNPGGEGVAVDTSKVDSPTTSQDGFAAAADPEQAIPSSTPAPVQPKVTTPEFA